ncbi:hypothetical protein Q4F19_05825 [Sphingomonas sp. BIUV-7]|uniref:Uncharacterized protein n=1 Tax=Sphingomonas natans TaxID=3063330 RepID=A0ABT8Y7K7_9SPHN|nr:hypothetical protein [Sphingomonas sp. BIUV-7]MDO6413893.1 hypothetical protein [Sphingomonas sp. BIUV-7]
MPLLLLPLILALTALGGDQGIADTKAPARSAPQAEPPTFDPDAPPSWWLTKMRRPCSKTGGRVSC